MKKKVEAKAKGGAAKQPPAQEATNAKKVEKDKISSEYKGRNRASRVVPPAKKKGGSVAGKTPEMRLDKRARGGAAKNPLSGADAPNLSYAKGDLGIDDGGKGKKISAP